MAKKKTRQDGRFEKKITVGKDHSGKVIRKSFYSTISQRDANTQAEQYKVRYLAGKQLDSKIKFRDWANTRLETYKKGNVSEITYRQTYKGNIDNHIKPALGEYILSEITPFTLLEYMNSKAEFSQSVVEKQVLILNGIFETALDTDLIHKNPMKNVIPPTPSRSKEKPVWSSKQADIAFKFASTHECGLGLCIILKTGLRRGEAMGLRWDDFDLTENVLHIERNVTKSSDKQKYELVGNTKTKNHNRYIPFDKELAEFLKSIPNKTDYLFITDENNILSPQTFSKKYIQNVVDDLIKEQSDLPRLTPHDLRHTYGTLLREKGADIYTISRVLGPSEIAITEKIYIHNDVDVLKKAMQKTFGQ